MSLKTLIIRYSLFAIIATISNLATQRLFLLIDKSLIFFGLAVFAGTIVGLIVKYFLDKRWIFYDRSETLIDQGSKFMLYTYSGVFTTAIFWGTETIFWFIWQTHFMRELGAIIGLSIGYIVKYNLDRKFVFTDSYLGKKT